jgi:hypothetical protein
VAGSGAVLLQREVPQHVNEAVAAAARAAGIPVLLVRFCGSGKGGGGGAWGGTPAILAANGHSRIFGAAMS